LIRYVGGITDKEDNLYGLVLTRFQQVIVRRAFKFTRELVEGIAMLKSRVEAKMMKVIYFFCLRDIRKHGSTATKSLAIT